MALFLGHSLRYYSRAIVNVIFPVGFAVNIINKFIGVDAKLCGKSYILIDNDSSGIFGVSVRPFFEMAAFCRSCAYCQFSVFGYSAAFLIDRTALTGRQAYIIMQDNFNDIRL